MDEQNSEPILVPTTPKVVYANQRKDVLIALPWYKQTNPLTAFSVMGLIDRRRTSLMMNFGDAFVVHARNTLADLFLQSEAEWMLTVDDDMVVPFGQGRWLNSFTGMEIPEPFCNFNALDRLMSHGKTLVGALYFGRWRHGAAMFAEGMRDKNMQAYIRRGPHDRLLPTKWVGTGCLLIHRSVFLDIEKMFPHLARKRDGGTRGGNWFTSSEHDLVERAEQVYEALENARLGGTWNNYELEKAYSLLAEARGLSKSHSKLGTGEDVQFCTRAMQAGHQPHVDLGLWCGHVGHETYHPKNTT